MILYNKKQAPHFPVFTAFILYAVFETVVLFVVSRYGTHQAYFLAYWGLAAIGFLIQLGLIFEIGRIVLRPTGTWIQDARPHFLGWSAVGACIAAGLAFAVSPPGRVGLDLWSIRSSIFTSFLTCEVFLAMITATNRLGLTWRSHVMAISEGLTTWSVIALAGDVARYVTGWHKGNYIFDDVRSLASFACLVFWGVMFMLPEKQRAPLSPEMQHYLLALHQRVRSDLNILKPTDKTPL